jgi:S1-C subfamily serine protease
MSSLAAPVGANATDRTSDGAVVVTARVSGEIVYGAGTIVAENGTTIRVITANHVIAIGTLDVRFDDGTTVPARILVQFPTRDLAILEAQVSRDRADSLHPATLADARSNEAVHIWGSGHNGQALESAAVGQVGDDLPDGPADHRYALACDTCHRGDSGGGVFDASGALVGVYIGYFEIDSTRISVAATLPFEALKIARSNASSTSAALMSAVAADSESRSVP